MYSASPIHPAIWPYGSEKVTSTVSQGGSPVKMNSTSRPAMGRSGDMKKYISPLKLKTPVFDNPEVDVGVGVAIGVRIGVGIGVAIGVGLGMAIGVGLGVAIGV